MIATLTDVFSPRYFTKHEDGCWTWHSHDKRSMYGFVKYRGKSLSAHRLIYSFFHPLTEGMTLDHLCRNRTCVNPAHLEEVTLKENVLRGEGFYARNKRKQRCPQGHLLVKENCVPSFKDGRKCLTCLRERQRLYMQRKRKESVPPTGA